MTKPDEPDDPGPSPGSASSAPHDAGRRRYGAALLALSVAGAAQAADVSLNNTAIALAGSDLGMSAAERSFGASVGTLALAASILTVGSLGDRHGRRRLLEWCCVALVIGGIVTAAAPGFATYVVGRTLTGVGLAGTLALSMALIRSVAADSVAHATSLYFTGQVGFAVPLTLIGGGLIDLSWRLGYLVVPAVGVLALVLNRAFVPDAKAAEPRRPDPVGMVLIAIGLVGVIWGVSGASDGWDSPRVLVPTIVGATTLAAFLVWEHHTPEPALPVRLFRDPRLAGALTADVAFNTWQAVITLQLALLWQYVYGFSSLQVSWGQLPATLAMVVGAFAVGRLAARGLKAETMAVSGLVGITLATAIFALAGGSTPYWIFAAGLILGGFSRMVTETSAGQFFISGPPHDLVAATVAAKPAVGQASFALGLALSSTMLYGGLGRGTEAALDDSGLTSAQQAAATHWFNGGRQPAWAEDADTYDALMRQSRDIYVGVYQTTMLTFALFFLLMTAITAYFLWWRPRHREQP